MGIFGPIVSVLFCDLSVLIADISHGSAVGSELICDDCLRRTVPLHGFLQEPESREFKAFLGHKTLQHFALMIDGPPLNNADPVNLHEDLIEVPLPLRMPAKVSRTPRSDMLCEDRAKPINPKPDAFVTNVYPPFMKKVFYVSQRQREPDVHHHGQLDHFAGCFEIAKWVLAHGVTVTHRFKRKFP
jgi:hypothetical protein